MDLTPIKVCYLFRQPGRFFSIERIFGQLIPVVRRRMAVAEWVAPSSAFTPAQLWKNIRSAKKCRSGAANESSADVYHITGDIHYIVLALPSRRTLLTIHDCVFLYSATGVKRRVLKWLLLDLPVRRSRLITTISEATREDIIRHTNCPPEKVIVVPNPVADTVYHSPLSFHDAEPVLLFVGVTPNKNLFRVAEALDGISCRLDVIGKLSAEQQSALAGRKIRYTQRSGLTDQEMADGYAAADIILFPSTFEGFGLPIVEGQKAGRPVITSDLAPMKDTAGGGACLVDPYDPASIRAGVLRVIRDPAYRDGIVREGLRNITRFSAERIAASYIECYQKIANN
ncbi:glycosyltransferase family 1 protein [Puia sp.]|uniref:glycosyltransferase family 4 protein n=1 Tax=Puia sp. TaxID=2045100 RepID=UPI002F3F1B98